MSTLDEEEQHHTSPLSPGLSAGSPGLCLSLLDSPRALRGFPRASWADPPQSAMGPSTDPERLVVASSVGPEHLAAASPVGPERLAGASSVGPESLAVAGQK